MTKITLILILLLAATLRLYRLTDFPSGFNADEAALGYNAYSLLLTGRDEHGTPWPINLESFGDFKPAGYTYLLLPFIKVLGLTEFAVRLPSALFGIMGVLFIYLLVKELFSPKVALLSALLLTISPWHLHFSRGGWEVNVATTLILLGVWAFIRWIKTSHAPHLFLFVTVFVLSMYTYQSARVIAPILGLGLAIFHFKPLLSQLRTTSLALVTGLVLLIPLGVATLTSDASSRLSGVGLLADEGPLRRVEQLRGQHHDWDSALSRVLHNRPVIYSVQFVSNYLSHFSGEFLFISGDEIQRNKVPETGLLYLTDFIFLAFGVYLFIRNPSSSSRIVWLWLFVAPLASALTFQTPHALRAQSLVIPLTILLAFGMSRLPKIVIPLVVLLYSWQFSRYLHQYYVHYPQTYPAAWEYGFKDLVPYIASIQNNFDQVIITSKYDQPYIFFLFYSQYPPAQFQFNHTLSVRDRFNFSTVHQFDKYSFQAVSPDQINLPPKTLLVAAPGEVPMAGIDILNTITFPSGDPAFTVVAKP